MTVKSFVVSPFAENCYVCHDAGEAVLIDPGTATAAERDAVLDYVTRNGLTVRHLLLTHAHIDHILGCAFFAREFGMKWKLHEADLPLLDGAELQARMFGVELQKPPTPEPSLVEGETIRFGKATWEILHTPGHSPGSVSFYDEANGFVVSGDVLFQGSVGRTDLWQGSMPTLLNAIQQKLMPLPDETVVYSGHGPETTIGRERQTNPFIAGGVTG
jgi:glyoxylase-like metal-dependent hydrolase (beta-lactamase superfamily II)